jgi:hypothetical protein
LAAVDLQSQLFDNKNEMKQLTKTTFFQLLNNGKNVQPSEWQSAYETFASDMFTTSAMCNGVVFHNSLCLIKAELAYLQANISPKKKCGSPAVY